MSLFVITGYGMIWNLGGKGENVLINELLIICYINFIFSLYLFWVFRKWGKMPFKCYVQWLLHSAYCLPWGLVANRMGRIKLKFYYIFMQKFFLM